MAVTGRKPIEDRSQARNRMPPSPGTEWRDVEDVPYIGRPLPDRDISQHAADCPLPRELIESGVGWPVSTQRWWTAVSTMPHCVLWTEADWQIAYAAAEAHARFAEGWKGCASGAELRQREKQLGMTHDHRRDLRIRYVPAKTARRRAAGAEDLPADVTKLDDYRGL